jgi:hypothetical protein
MTGSNVQLNHEEIQDVTHRSLGRFFIAFARVELNLSLQVGGAGTFEEKLERFYKIFIPGGSDLRFLQNSAWYTAAHSMRLMRNRFAHGRWAFHTHNQNVVHVSGYPPDPQDEFYLSLDELDSIVKDVDWLDEELYRIVLARMRL